MGSTPIDIFQFRLGTAEKRKRSAPVRVLLADGKRTPRRRAAAMLRADGRFELCACVADAPSAVAAALEHEPDVCVLDVGLPGGGTAAAQEIAARLPQARRGHPAERCRPGADGVPPATAAPLRCRRSKPV